MGTDDLQDYELAIDTLDADHARRVALLVVECHASLSDAIAAVQLADRLVAEQAPRWLARPSIRQHYREMR